MVIISNGFNKFHLAAAASQMAAIGRLCYILTGAYPIRLSEIVTRFPLHAVSNKAKRLLDRGESLTPSQVQSLWLPEMIDKIGIISQGIKSTKISEWLRISSMRQYGKMAGKILRKGPKSCKIFHYRSGFGGESVEIAKNLGMITLCDHSIVHPALILYMINNWGKMPPMGVSGSLNHFWRWILSDIEQADYVLVNSEFARSTFIHQGWKPEKIHCVYLGVDEQFLGFLNSAQVKKNSSESFRLLFGGTFEKRKGAESIIAAIQTIRNDDWRLEIAGEIDPSIIKQNPAFFNNSCIQCSGILLRSQLALKMKSANVFILPSLVEGSARVIFEAMACGCYIITTPNAGSIVQNGVHGALVPSHDPGALRQAILWAMENSERIGAIGAQNAALIQRNFRPNDYGVKLTKLYDRLLCRRSTSQKNVEK